MAPLCEAIAVLSCGQQRLTIYDKGALEMVLDRWQDFGPRHQPREQRMRPCEEYEEALHRIAEKTGLQPQRVGQAAAWSRELGHGDLARRLGKCSQRRRGEAHPDVRFIQQLDRALRGMDLASVAQARVRFERPSGLRSGAHASEPGGQPISRKESVDRMKARQNGIYYDTGESTSSSLGEGTGIDVRFHTSKSGGQQDSPKENVDRMTKGQNDIYYITGASGDMEPRTSETGDEQSAGKEYVGRMRESQTDTYSVAGTSPITIEASGISATTNEVIDSFAAADAFDDMTDEEVRSRIRRALRNGGQRHDPHVIEAIVDSAMEDLRPDPR